MLPTEQEALNKLGLRIKKLREEQNLSQFQFSLVCDITLNQVGRIERAEINTTYLTLLKIANALEIDIKELV